MTKLTELDAPTEDVSHADTGLMSATIDALTAELAQARADAALWKSRAEQISRDSAAEINELSRAVTEAKENVAALKHDIDRHIAVASELATENERMRATLDATRSDIEWVAGALRKVTRPEWVDNLIARIDAAGHWMRDTGPAVRDVLSETAAGPACRMGGRWCRLSRRQKCWLPGARNCRPQEKRLMCGTPCAPPHPSRQRGPAR